MREFIKKLLDEDNRQADLAAFGQLVALTVSVFFSLLMLGSAAWSTFKTGQISNGALALVGFWIGAAFGYGSVDKLGNNLKAPAPSAAPPPTQAPTTPKPATDTPKPPREVLP